ncbi:hypothetical protein SteCoe_26139 [Stentor coeruleus]|uniref:Uncharacterized protein n=1 Tax=Stentor coeruleus TaxID=5963 RepID=A0A1R2BDL7_9CILI|nr:hypothetical protein SteCoe_26139 [Stentor coeruleus]
MKENYASNVVDWIEAIESLIIDAKSAKKSLRNEINELRLSLQLLENDAIKQVDMTKAEQIALPVSLFVNESNNCDSQFQAYSRSIDYLREDFTDVSQKLIKLECELSILEEISGK